jgi:hypothetical protein
MGTHFRTSQKRPQRNFIHIYSNGYSELDYFILKKAELGIRNVIIEPKFENCGNPKQILQQIAKKYSSGDVREKDKVFCVIDIDETTDSQIEDGIKIKAKYIQLILSNPSLEVWFLLHFKYYTSKIMMEEAVDTLKTHIPDYSKERKQMKKTYLKLKGSEKKAIRNAQQLRDFHLKTKTNLFTRSANPYTSVDLLVKLLHSLE